MAATTTGPDFVSFQVRDRAVSAKFYEELVGLTRLPDSNPAATVFSAGGAAFAVRDPFPGVDLDAMPQLGAGAGVWFHNDDAEGVHARLPRRRCGTRLRRRRRAEASRRDPHRGTGRGRRTRLLLRRRRSPRGSSLGGV